MNDEPQLPDYLVAQQRERQATVDRSRLCPCINLQSFQADVTCEWCNGTGLNPSDDDDELSPDEIRAMGLTPIEPGDPRGERETFIEGLDS